MGTSRVRAGGIRTDGIVIIRRNYSWKYARDRLRGVGRTDGTRHRGMGVIPFALAVLYARRETPRRGIRSTTVLVLGGRSRSTADTAGSQLTRRRTRR